MPQPTSLTVTVPTLVTESRVIKELHLPYARVRYEDALPVNPNMGNLVRAVKLGNPRMVVEGVCYEVYARAQNLHDIYIASTATEDGHIQYGIPVRWDSWDIFLLPENFRESINFAHRIDRRTA